MYITDSHIHLQDYKRKNAHQIIGDMQGKGFGKVICVSAKQEDWPKVKKLAEEIPEFVIPSFGVHPWYVTEVSGDWNEKLEVYLQKYSNAVVGECGLDGIKGIDWKKQEEIFVMQADLAKRYNRPMNIHLLKAEDRFCRLQGVLPKKFLLHAFGGSVDFLKKIIDWGGYVSLSYALLKRKNFVNVVKNVPVERLLLESDGPYMSEYDNIEMTAEKIAELIGMCKAGLIEKVYKNFEEFCYGR